MDSAGVDHAGSIQIIRPCGEAWHHMKGMLFPFDLGKWITLGFVAWLAMLGQGRYGTSFGRGFWDGSGTAPGPSPKEIFEQVLRYMADHLGLVALVAGAGALVFMAIYLALTYLGSRGVFMYLDCVVRRKAKVVEPWRRARKPAWSLFLWRVLVSAVAGVLGLLIIGIVILVAWPDIRQMRLTPRMITACLIGGGFLALVLIAFGVMQWLLRNLVATIMYLRGVSGLEAWSEFFALARGRVGGFVLYLLMNIALGLLYWIATFPVVCCTCCLGALPVVRHTILQPLLLWMRAYPIYFLAQFGGPYRLVGAEPSDAAAEPAPERAKIVSCPQCGQEHRIPDGAPGTYACVKCGAHFEV